MSHDIINSWRAPQRKHIQTSYTNSKFNCHGVCYIGRQDRPKEAQSENEHIHGTNIQCFSFDFLCTWDFPEISLQGLGFGQTLVWEMGFGQNLDWEMGFIPPPPPPSGPSTQALCPDTNPNRFSSVRRCIYFLTSC